MILYTYFMKNFFRLITLLVLFSTSAEKDAFAFRRLTVSIKAKEVVPYPYSSVYYNYFPSVWEAAHILTACEVDFTITNTGDSIAYYWMGVCSKLFNLTFGDGKPFRFLFWGCTHDYPVPYSLEPGESDSFSLVVGRSFDPNYTTNYILGDIEANRLRIGLELVNDLSDIDNCIYYDDRMRDKKKWAWIIWSNSIVI